jgi:hypothetical protein
MTHTNPANANEPSDVEVLATQAGRYVFRGVNAHNAKAARVLSPVQDPVVPAPTEPSASRRRRNLMAQLAKLAAQPSAWRGGIMFLTGLGIAMDPEWAAHISAVGMALAGLVGMFVDDNRAAE